MMQATTKLSLSLSLTHAQYRLPTTKLAQAHFAICKNNFQALLKNRANACSCSMKELAKT
jgi:hypothetical protein